MQAVAILRVSVVGGFRVPHHTREISCKYGLLHTFNLQEKCVWITGNIPVCLSCIRTQRFNIRPGQWYCWGAALWPLGLFFNAILSHLGKREWLWVLVSMHVRGCVCVCGLKTDRRKKCGIVHFVGRWQTVCAWRWMGTLGFGKQECQTDRH